MEQTRDQPEKLARISFGLTKQRIYAKPSSNLSLLGHLYIPRIFSFHRLCSVCFELVYAGLAECDNSIWRNICCSFYLLPCFSLPDNDLWSRSGSIFVLLILSCGNCFTNCEDPAKYSSVLWIQEKTPSTRVRIEVFHANARFPVDCSSAFIPTDKSVVIRVLSLTIKKSSVCKILKFV